MPKTLQASISCIQCHQPFRTTFQNVVDAQQDPQGKMRLLTGQLNLAQCPNCGAPNTMMTPMVYHDASKELLITFVPMELGLPKEAQEKTIGDLVRGVTSELPQGAFKAYLLQPRQALTMQGLIDQVLQADGVTPEMMEAQRARVRLIESLLETADEEIPALVKENDAQIDSQFMQTISLLAQRMLQEGRQGIAERLVLLQNLIVESSTFGQQLME
ncbi:MAG TPA: CpXC domain-containing protein, partial [Phototrophicaceae bacterium]|nr:CpXC domain-containing protein [Phototrophicaceae bacterium]